MEGWTDTVYRVCVYILKIAYLNLLWVVFSILGLVILGIFPSTIALFTTIRKVIQKSDSSITALFWQTYKSKFFKGNIVCYILLIIGVVIGADIIFIYYQVGVLLDILFYILIVLSLVYLFMIINFLPVYVHYDLKLFGYIKQALFIGFLRFWFSMTMVVSLFAVWVIMYFSPGLFIFFGISFPTYILMFIAYRNFVSLEQDVRGKLEVTASTIKF